MTNLTQRAAPAGAVEPSSSNAKGGPRNIGVAARVLIVTLSFVLLVQFAFLAVRMSSLRDNWLQGRVTAASAAASLLAAAPDGVISAAATANALKIVGAKSITVTQRGDTRLFGEIVDPATIDSSFRIEEKSHSGLRQFPEQDVLSRRSEKQPTNPGISLRPCQHWN